MTRSKQVAAALSVLLDDHPDGFNTDPWWRSFCTEEVEECLRDIEECESFDTLSGYEFEHAHIRSPGTKRELKKAIKHLRISHDVLAKLPPRVRRSFVDINKQIRRARLWASLQRGRPIHTGFKQSLAVVSAAMLFETTLQKVGATRKGRWHRLAAILYGDKPAIGRREPGIDFLNHMRKFEREHRKYAPHLFPPHKHLT